MNKDIKYICCFIGWGRSGNSLVGALLNFHPNIYIKNEYLMVRKEVKKEEDITDTIVKTVKGRKKPQVWGGFRHEDIGLKKKEPLVVGGKKAGGTSHALMDNHDEFCRVFDDVIRTPVKWIHVQRNPFDNISSFRKGGTPEKKIDIYFKQAEAVKEVINTRDCITIRLESLCARPMQIMEELCNYYEVPVMEQHLKHCAKVVWDYPRVTRNAVDWWTSGRIKDVENRMKKYSFFRGYSY